MYDKSAERGKPFGQITIGELSENIRILFTDFRREKSVLPSPASKNRQLPAAAGSSVPSLNSPAPVRIHPEFSMIYQSLHMS